MSEKKLPKPKKKDRDWQEKVANNLKKEKIQLDHPKALERFQTVINNINKKK
jgi:hypothetical protein